MTTATEHETTGHENGDAPTAHAAPVATTCPSCGATAEPGQLMCLECGARLALDYQRAPSWRLPAAIVGVILLLAGAGVAFALATVTNDAENTTASAPTQPAATPSPEQAPADTPPTASTPTQAPADSSGTTPAATPESGGTAPADGDTATPEPAPTPTAEGWPPGKSAFTVILASMPTKAAAEDKLEKAHAAGISGAAILHSDDFPTLRPGYWVVFDGQFDTAEQASAQADADRAKGEFGDAYPRFVSKNPDARP